MAILDIPPNPNAAPPSPDRQQHAPEEPLPIKVRAGKYGDLEQHELVRLLDSFDDERSRGRFRESIYVSIFVYLALAWLILFGPRVLFHQGQLINIKDAKHDKNMTMLDMPKDLTKLAPPKVAPKLDRKTLDQLQAMRRAAEAKRPPAPTPAPAPDAFAGHAAAAAPAADAAGAAATPAGAAADPSRAAAEPRRAGRAQAELCGEQ